MKFRKKPVVIDAVQWTGQPIEGCQLVLDLGNPDHLVIPTLEGDMIASLGDWIVTGVKGERYPCKPDIFEQCYERAE